MSELSPMGMSGLLMDDAIDQRRQRELDRDKLADLLAKVQAATKADRALDLTLATALVPDVIVLRQRDDDSGADPYTHWEYTGSIDDALALVQRMLPGWSLQLHHHPSAAYATLYRLGDITEYPTGQIIRSVASPYFEGIRIEDDCAALAIIEATLRALSQEPSP